METLAPFSLLHLPKLCVVLYHFPFLPMYTVPLCTLCSCTRMLYEFQSQLIYKVVAYGAKVLRRVLA